MKIPNFLLNNRWTSVIGAVGAVLTLLSKDQIDIEAIIQAAIVAGLGIAAGDNKKAPNKK